MAKEKKSKEKKPKDKKLKDKKPKEKKAEIPKNYAQFEIAYNNLKNKTNEYKDRLFPTGNKAIYGKSEKVTNMPGPREFISLNAAFKVISDKYKKLARLHKDKTLKKESTKSFIFVKVSKNMDKFLKLSNRDMNERTYTKTNITSYINAYFQYHKLQYSDNKKVYRLNDDLKKLFKHELGKSVEIGKKDKKHQVTIGEVDGKEGIDSRLIQYLINKHIETITDNNDKNKLKKDRKFIESLNKDKYILKSLKNHNEFIKKELTNIEKFTEMLAIGETEQNNEMIDYYNNLINQSNSKVEEYTSSMQDIINKSKIF